MLQSAKSTNISQIDYFFIIGKISLCPDEKVSQAGLGPRAVVWRLWSSGTAQLRTFEATLPRGAQGWAPTISGTRLATDFTACVDLEYCIEIVGTSYHQHLLCC